MVWNFQHITHVGGDGSAYTENETITALDSVGEGGKAWAVANITSNGVGPDSVTVGTRTNAGMSFRCQLSTTTNLQINYQSATEDRRIYFSIWEQPSTATADRVDITEIAVPYLYNTTSSDPTVDNGTDRDDIVLFKQALRATTASMAADAMLVTGKILNSYAGRFERGGSDISTFGYVPCVEFWGTDYTIQTAEVSSHTAGTTKVTTLASTVNWDETLIIASYRVANGSDKDADVGFLVWPGADGDKLNTRVHADHSDASNAVIRYYLISNANWFVDHDDSIDGSLSQIGSSTSEEDITISEISGLSKAAPVCFAYTGGTGQNYPRSAFTYGLTSTTNLRFFRGKTGVAADIAIQILDTDPDNRPGASADYSYSAGIFSAIGTLFAPTVTTPGGTDVNLTVSIFSAAANILDFALDDDVVTNIEVGIFSAVATLNAASTNIDTDVSINVARLLGTATLFDPVVTYPSSSGSPFDADSVGTSNANILDLNVKIAASILNASDLEASTGEKIKTIVDQSSHGNDAVQTDVSKQLTLIASGINSANGILGNSGAVMEVENTSIMRDLAGSTSFFVLKYNDQSAYQVLMSVFGASFVYRYYAYINDTDDVNHVAHHPDATAAGVYTGATDLTHDTIHVIAIQDNYIGQESSIWIDGVKVFTESSFGSAANLSDTASPANMFVFAADGGATLGSPSTFSRILLYDEKLSDADVGIAMTGLADEAANASTGVDYTYSAVQLTAAATLNAIAVDSEINYEYTASIFSATTSLLTPTVLTDADRTSAVSRLEAIASLYPVSIDIEQDISINVARLTATAILNPIGSGEVNNTSNDCGLRTIINVAVECLTKQGVSKEVAISSQGFVDDPGSFAIIQSIRDLGDNVTGELPDSTEATLILDNRIGEIGYNRRFSDLFDQLVFINRTIRINIESWSIEGAQIETLESYVGVVSRYQVSGDFEKVNLKVVRKNLQNRPINYVIKDGPNVIPSAVGRAVPVVLGDWREVRPIKLQDHVYAYGTNFSNQTVPSHFAVQKSTDLPQLFATNSEGIARQLDISTPPQLTPTYSTLDKYALSKRTGEAIENAFVPLGDDFYQFGRICTGGVWTVSAHPDAFTIPDAAETVYIFTIYEFIDNVVGKKIAESIRRRKDFASERNSRSPFNIEFVFPSPVALVNRNEQGFGAGYAFTISETTLGEHGVDDWMTFSVSNGSPSSDDIVQCVHHKRFDVEWNVGTAKSGFGAYNNICTFPALGLRYATATIERHTKTSLKTSEYETSAQIEKDGLSMSVLELTEPTTTIGSNLETNLSWSKFKIEYINSPPVVEVAPYATNIAALLLSKVDNAGDWQAAGTNGVMAGYGISEANSGSKYRRQVSAAFESLTYRRQALEQVLYWTHGKLLPFGISGAEEFSLFFFGSIKDTFTTITEDDFLLESFSELGMETVVNNPRLSYDFKYGAVRNQGGFTVTSGQSASVVSSGSFEGGRLAQKELSESLYGKNYLLTEQTRFFKEEQDAKSSIHLFNDRYAKPNTYIKGHVPLKKYKGLKIGDIVLLSHSFLPTYYGSDSNNVDGIKGDLAAGVQFADGAALGSDQRRGQSYRCLIEGSTINKSATGIASIKLTLLHLPNETRIL